MTKHAKDEVDYSKGMMHSHCGPTYHTDRFYCKHFIHKPARISGECEVVEGGIMPEMWCELYKRIKKS